MLARLPIPAGPARHEIVLSYLTRLTVLHGLPEGELWNHLSTTSAADQPARKRGRVVADRLAVATGRPVEHLVLALPELRDRHWTGRPGGTSRSLAVRAATPATTADRCYGCCHITTTSAPGIATGSAHPTPGN
ncbi:TniQ family protein [Mycobacterium camsae]|uniref:TniQ family protein n=1 Tax=Mycobacterium gordonae TaxID=1778 RepID=UPI00197E64DD|nr:TniQ family protein [Mycobacterium gordonae]